MRDDRLAWSGRHTPILVALGGGWLFDSFEVLNRAGVLLGFAVPVIRSQAAGGPDAGPGLAEHFEHRFRPLSAGFAVPVFAFFAAGVSVGGAGGLGATLADSSVLTWCTCRTLDPTGPGKPAGVVDGSSVRGAAVIGAPVSCLHAACSVSAWRWPGSGRRSVVAGRWWSRSLSRKGRPVTAAAHAEGLDSRVEFLVGRASIEDPRPAETRA